MRDFLQNGDDRHWALAIVVYTRHWIHYGALFFFSVLILAAAAEGLLLP
ncbi:MAG TPA: hypothetical protein VM120_22770 [Bryobacteraceae bacterium]|nr:hypothetical protein [Bryobacteraceae bacterium]